MSLFTNIIKGLNEFNSNAWGYVGDELNRKSDPILSINTSRLYAKGTDSENAKIRNSFADYRVYSKQYTKRKKRLGLYNGHVNLKLSGEYLDSYELEANDTEVEIDINPGNADLGAVLAAMYGEDIKGLTEEEWAFVVGKFIYPRLIKELKKAFK